MRGGEQRQDELDAVAEQYRDSVTPLKAEFAKPSRDLRGLPPDFAPAHSALATNQRFAIGVARHGIGNHRPDAFRPLAKRRHDAITESRL
jgi:hypothetical protein